MEEAVEKARRVVAAYDEYSSKPKYRRAAERANFTGVALLHSLDVARALLSSSERVKELEKMLAFYTSTPRS